MFSEVGDTDEVTAGDVIEIDEKLPFIFTLGNGAYVRIDDADVDVYKEVLLSQYSWHIPDGIELVDEALDLSTNYVTWYSSTTRYGAMAIELRVKAKFLITEDAVKGNQPLSLRLPSLVAIADFFNAKATFPEQYTKEKLIAPDVVQVHTIRVYGSSAGAIFVTILKWVAVIAVVLHMLKSFFD